jgi:ribonuclease HI
MLFYVYTDGASRSNPGKSASGYELFDKEHKLIAKESMYNGIKTNNQAEYIAIIEALGRIGRDFGFGNELYVYSDSQLVVRQLLGEYKVKEKELRVLHSRAADLIKRFNSVKITNVPRENEHISSVDASLNELLDTLEG